jgi:hypothetical protein
MHLLDTAGKVIDQLGGTAEVSRLTRRSMQNVSNWRLANKIPAKWFLVMRKELRRLGYVAPPELWGIVGTNGETE